MKNINLSWLIYIISAFPLTMLMHWYKKEVSNDWLLVVIAIIYLIAVRLIGDFIASKLQKQNK